MRVAEKIADPNVDEDLYIDIVDHFGFTSSKIGDTKTSLKSYKKLALLRPHNDRFRQNVEYYTKMIDKNRYQLGENNLEGTTFDPLTTTSADNPSWRTDKKEYEKLCRQTQANLKPEDQAKLSCFYWSGYHPYLIWQPYKAEMLWHSPQIVQFYDILNDKEMDAIIAMGRPQLKWATVQDPETGNLINADYRISESAWLKPTGNGLDNDHIIQKYRKRISMITGLTMEKAEDVQLANYGIGGQYEPHFDHATEHDAGGFDEEDGNRLATWLSYIEQPLMGGGTVFLEPGIQAEPVRGSAVFWYNLLRDGSSDYRTRHAACPVVAGEKWVSNIWLHERGEEFTRPCLTEINSEMNSI